jgi:hypothetical protein
VTFKHRIKRLRSFQPAEASLVAALKQAAVERQHDKMTMARSLGLTKPHLYRLLIHPGLMGRCTPQTLNAIARYAQWSRGAVYVAAGLLSAEDLSAWPSQEATQKSLDELQRCSLLALISTPIADAAQDHQRLMAILFRYAQGQAIAGE